MSGDIKEKISKKISRDEFSGSEEQLKACDDIIEYAKTKGYPPGETRVVSEYQEYLKGTASRNQSGWNELDEIVNQASKTKLDKNEHHLLRIGGREVFLRCENSSCELLYRIGHNPYYDLNEYGYAVLEKGLIKTSILDKQLILSPDNDLTEVFSLDIKNEMEKAIVVMDTLSSMEDLDEALKQVELLLADKGKVNSPQDLETLKDKEFKKQYGAHPCEYLERAKQVHENNLIRLRYMRYGTRDR